MWVSVCRTERIWVCVSGLGWYRAEHAINNCRLQRELFTTTAGLIVTTIMCIVRMKGTCPFTSFFLPVLLSFVFFYFCFFCLVVPSLMLYLFLFLKACSGKFNIFDGSLVRLFVFPLLPLKAFSSFTCPSDCHVFFFFFVWSSQTRRNADIIRAKQNEWNARICVDMFYPLCGFDLNWTDFDKTTEGRSRQQKPAKTQSDYSGTSLDLEVKALIR